MPYRSFERRVWHYGDIGKTHLPDLPRGDNLEYDEFWNREYAVKIDESRELFTTVVNLVSHTCNTYLALCLQAGRNDIPDL